MMFGTWRKCVLFAALVALGVALGACGGDGAGGGVGFSAEPVAQRVAVAADRSGALRWDRATYEAVAGDVSFVVSNASPVPHQFAIAGNGVRYRSQTLKTNTTVLTIKALPAGEYQIVCDYPGHKAAGMIATLVVR